MFQVSDSIRNAFLLNFLIVLMMTVGIILLLGLHTYQSYNTTHTLQSHGRTWYDTYALDDGIMNELQLVVNLRHKKAFEPDSNEYISLEQQIKANQRELQELLDYFKSHDDHGSEEVSSAARINQAQELILREDFLNLGKQRDKFLSPDGVVGIGSLIEKYSDFLARLDRFRSQILFHEDTGEFALANYLVLGKSIFELRQIFQQESAQLGDALISQAGVDEDTSARLQVYRSQINLLLVRIDSFIEGVFRQRLKNNPAEYARIYKTNENLQAAFTAIDETRREIYSVAMLGDVPSLSYEDWQQQVNNTLNVIGELSRVSIRPADQALDDHVRDQFVWMLFTLFLAMIALLSFFILYRIQHLRVLSPIENLTQTMTKIANGDLDVDLPKGGQDEVGRMIDTLRSFRELEIRREKTEQASKAKDEFLANMSHELRTPLNSIIGMGQLMKDRVVDPDTAEMLASIEASSHNLLQIVNDILDLSKIESGNIQLENIPFDLVDVTSKAIGALKPLASKNRVNLTSTLDADTFMVQGDPLRYTRILNNLIGNAIRFAKGGNVQVNIRIGDRHFGKATIYAEIIDDGIGIPADKLDTIFQKFSQVDSSIARKFGGTGLGLAITQELVEMMGGRIGVKSQVGKGSIFWFQIDLSIADGQSQPAAGENQEYPNNQLDRLPIAAGRYLLAEDHEMNQIFMKKLFKNFGIENYTIVANGRDAVEAVRTQQFDLIFMDCHMPEMTGYEASMQIRKLSDPARASIPIVAMTADAMPDTEAKCIAAGMNAYISKPFHLNQFKKVVSRWIVFPS